MSNTPVLKAQSLGIQFGGLKAVTDFNMEIGQSELLGLIGQLTEQEKRQSLICLQEYISLRRGVST